MNYYEELGVRQDASIEDIRQAYKMMARLLHPDRQVDPSLKPIADLQMKRLAEIVGLLIDPRTRCHYDEALLLGNHLQTPCRRRARLMPASAAEPWHGGSDMAGFAVRYWVWILTGAFVLGLGAWSFMQPNLTVPVREVQEEALPPNSNSQRRPVPRQAKPRLTLGMTPGMAKTSRLRAAPRVPPAEETRIPAIAPPEHHSGSELEDVPPVLFVSPEPLSEVGQSPPVDSLPPLRSESSFIGRWLYSPKAGEVGQRGVYPATYVELHLVERGGEMVGDYHALYKVHDQAVSPEVAFQIQGAAVSATFARFAWVARDNAKGQVEMTLQGPNVLCVTWWTTAFGRQATLGSGTSVLIRQQAP